MCSSRSGGRAASRHATSLGERCGWRRRAAVRVTRCGPTAAPPPRPVAARSSSVRAACLNGAGQWRWVAGLAGLQAPPLRARRSSGCSAGLQGSSASQAETRDPWWGRVLRRPGVRCRELAGATQSRPRLARQPSSRETPLHVTPIWRSRFKRPAGRDHASLRCWPAPPPQHRPPVNWQGSCPVSQWRRAQRACWAGAATYVQLFNARVASSRH